VCAAAVAGCLVAERAGSQRGLWLAKPLASATFLWAAWAWGALESPFGRWLALGLVACFVGDLLLTPKQAPRALRAGMAAFALGHLLFARAFLVRGVSPLAAALGALVALAFVLAAWRWLRPRLRAADRLPVGVYAGVIGGMMVCAIGATGGGAPLAAAAGALLFALSDLSVAQDRFLAPSFVSTLWGLPAYYAAQHLLAWSAGA
jgi:uncharacterized membrane protein YhhN